MTTLAQMALDLLQMDLDSKLVSIVRGNRNWAIRTEKNGVGKDVAYVGRQGLMHRRGFLSCYISEIGERHIRFYNFTYKKDFDKAVETLENMGYVIHWMY